MKVTEAERKDSTKRSCGSGCPQRGRAEHEEYAEALIGKRMTENNLTNADRQEDGLLEAIVSAGNMNRAYKRVKKNKGASGVDGMKVEELAQLDRVARDGGRGEDEDDEGEHRAEEGEQHTGAQRAVRLALDRHGTPVVSGVPQDTVTALPWVSNRAGGRWAQPSAIAITSLISS